MACVKQRDLISVCKIKFYWTVWTTKNSDDGLVTKPKLQDGARNVIPLIVHVTHFYYYKSI